jgi:ankyrin repeat protein
MLSSELINAINTSNYQRVLRLTRDVNDSRFINREILNLDRTDSFGRNLLHYTAGAHFMIFDLMMQRFENLYTKSEFSIYLDKPDGEFMTPLHIAVMHHRTHNVVNILNLNGGHNMADSRGYTPLMYAVLYTGQGRNNLIAEHLLCHPGIDLFKVDIQGLTALDHARNINNVYLQRIMHSRLGLTFRSPVGPTLSVPDADVTPRLDSPTVLHDPMASPHFPHLSTTTIIGREVMDRANTGAGRVIGEHTARIIRQQTPQTTPIRRRYDDVAYDTDTSAPETPTLGNEEADRVRQIVRNLTRVSSSDSRGL